VGEVPHSSKLGAKTSPLAKVPVTTRHLSNINELFNFL
jgi:hypothetical protein